MERKAIHGQYGLVKKECRNIVFNIKKDTTLALFWILCYK